MASKLVIGKEELETLYKTHSTEEIGRMYGVCAEIVRRKMHALGLTPRKRGAIREFNPVKEELSALYQVHSMRDISRIYNVGETVVWKRLKEHGIQLRDYEDGGHRKKPGRTFSKEAKANMSRAQRGKTGDKASGWKGGISITNLIARRTGAYKQWKRESLERANNRCESCGVEHNKTCECCGTQTKLHVHHIESFALYPDKRFDPKNSEVLCPKCHRNRHK